MTGSSTDRYWRCEPLEVAVGWVYGDRQVERPASRVSARQALEDAIRSALAEGPCYVTFSGGRDSSAVLAVAAHVARREGFDPPIPVTRVYPDLPSTDESSWQQQVIAHLGLTEWLRLELRAAESDLLGDSSCQGLRSRGLIFPPALQAHDVMFRHLRGGSLLTGEGGDAVLGGRRITPLALLRNGRRPSRMLVARAANAMLPRAVRQRRVRAIAQHSTQSRWLQPAALLAHAAHVADDETRAPLRYDLATWCVASQRAFAMIGHNHSTVAGEYGIKASDPLLDPAFISALGWAGGVWGFTSRTSTMSALFSDVLPQAVIARPTKAWFNSAHCGEPTREFARSWDGSGVDPDLVDAEKLRAVWLSDEPTMAAGMLLQSAWLASKARVS